MTEAGIEDSIREIVEDRSRGASQLARRCLALLAKSAEEAAAEDSAELLGVLCAQADMMINARPSMAPVQNLLLRWKVEIEPLDGGELAAVRRQAAEIAAALAQASRAAVQAAATHARALVREGQTLITLSLSSTVLEVFRGLRGRAVAAIVAESRPLCEGLKLAKQLSRWRVPVTLITDAEIGLFVPQADLALVGADSLLPDGSVVNKAGTCLLGLAAREHGVPFYVCCESFKRRVAADAPEFEEMDPAELGVPPIPGVRIRNVYFDLTPARLVTGWITEEGISRPA